MKIQPLNRPFMSEKTPSRDWSSERNCIHIFDDPQIGWPRQKASEQHGCSGSNFGFVFFVKVSIYSLTAMFLYCCELYPMENFNSELSLNLFLKTVCCQLHNLPDKVEIRRQLQYLLAIFWLYSTYIATIRAQVTTNGGKDGDQPFDML